MTQHLVAVTVFCAIEGDVDDPEYIAEKAVSRRIRAGNRTIPTSMDVELNGTTYTVTAHMIKEVTAAANNGMLKVSPTGPGPGFFLRDESGQV